MTSNLLLYADMLPPQCTMTSNLLLYAALLPLQRGMASNVLLCLVAEQVMIITKEPNHYFKILDFAWSFIVILVITHQIQQNKWQITYQSQQNSDKYVLKLLHTSDIWSVYVSSARQQIGRTPVTVLHRVKWICRLFKQHCYEKNTESSSCGQRGRFWNE